MISLIAGVSGSYRQHGKTNHMPKELQACRSKLLCKVKPQHLWHSKPRDMRAAPLESIGRPAAVDAKYYYYPKGQPTVQVLGRSRNVVKGVVDKAIAA